MLRPLTRTSLKCLHTPPAGGGSLGCLDLQNRPGYGRRLLARTAPQPAAPRCGFRPLLRRIGSFPFLLSGAARTRASALGLSPAPQRRPSAWRLLARAHAPGLHLALVLRAMAMALVASGWLSALLPFSGRAFPSSSPLALPTPSFFLRLFWLTAQALRRSPPQHSYVVLPL